MSGRTLLSLVTGVVLTGVPLVIAWQSLEMPAQIALSKRVPAPAAAKPDPDGLLFSYQGAFEDPPKRLAFLDSLDQRDALGLLRVLDTNQSEMVQMGV